MAASPDDKILAFRAAYRREIVPTGYSGRAHVVLALAVARGAIAVGLGLVVALVTLLHDTPRPSQLGADIGFVEQSFLCRACRRWTGHAPLPLKGRLAGLFQALRPPAGLPPAS